LRPVDQLPSWHVQTRREKILRRYAYGIFLDTTFLSGALRH
jgi:hypothetical protein